MSNFHSDLRGLDLHSPSNELVENNSGFTIPSLRAVSFSSLGTSYPQIFLSDSNIKGITSQTILNGQSGYITAFGMLVDINTSAFAVGSKLYAQSGGILSTTPNGKSIALVLKQHASNGIIYVSNEIESTQMLGNHFWIKTGVNAIIPETHENIVSAPFILEGTIQIDGRLTIL